MTLQHAELSLFFQAYISHMILHFLYLGSDWSQLKIGSPLHTNLLNLSLPGVISHNVLFSVSH